jgi:hypothetical protein
MVRGRVYTEICQFLTFSHGILGGMLSGQAPLHTQRQLHQLTALLNCENSGVTRLFIR